MVVCIKKLMIPQVNGAFINVTFDILCRRNVPLCITILIIFFLHQVLRMLRKVGLYLVPVPHDSVFVV